MPSVFDWYWATDAYEKSLHDPGELVHISTGHLPDAAVVQSLIEEAYAQLRSNTDGQNSQVYPALARVPSQMMGICVVGTSGHVYAVGDSDHEFTIMSVSKPFVFALVAEFLGTDTVREKVGVNATGRAFNSVEGI